MVKLSVDRNLSRAKSHAKRGEFEEARKLYLAILEVFAENKRAQEGLAAPNERAPALSKKALCKNRSTISWDYTIKAN